MWPLALCCDRLGSEYVLIYLSFNCAIIIIMYTYRTLRFLALVFGRFLLVKTIFHGLELIASSLLLVLQDLLSFLWHLLGSRGEASDWLHE